MIYLQGFEVAEGISHHLNTFDQSLPWRAPWPCVNHGQRSLPQYSRLLSLPSARNPKIGCQCDEARTKCSLQLTLWARWRINRKPTFDNHRHEAAGTSYMFCSFVVDDFVLKQPDQFIQARGSSKKSMPSRFTTSHHQVWMVLRLMSRVCLADTKIM